MLDALQSLTSFFLKGGTFMWPLLVCSVMAVTTIILRTIALREKNVIPLVVESELERLVPGGNPERLARVVHHDPSSLARIVRVALAHLRWPRADNVEAVQTRARHEMVRPLGCALARQTRAQAKAALPTPRRQAVRPANGSS